MDGQILHCYFRNAFQISINVLNPFVRVTDILRCHKFVHIYLCLLIFCFTVSETN